MKPAKEAPQFTPYSPARLSSDIVYAVQAIRAGEALPAQQSLFFQWLIVEVCRKDDLSWRPGGRRGDRDTSLAEGKRFVALQVLKALNMPPEMVAMMREAEAKRTKTEGDEIGE